MGRLRSFYDADRFDTYILPTDFKTERNQHEVFCGVCGERFYVDDQRFEEISKVIGETLETPFLCEDCLQEYEEMAHRK